MQELPFIGEIRIVGFDFPPQGWAFCNGQLLQIADNDALWNLIGTTYGGDGVETFGLPDLRGRVPLGVDFFDPQATTGGAETHTLTEPQLPAHGHRVRASAANGTSSQPAGRLLAAAPKSYGPASSLTPLRPEVLADGDATTTKPHPNMQPYLAVRFIISLFGIFPSQS